MLKEAKESEIDNIILFLKPHIQSCVYLYIDIKKYRLTNPDMMIWIDKDDNSKIKMVAMKYHTSITIYADDLDCDIEGALELIFRFSPYSISTTPEIARWLQVKIADLYKFQYGMINQFFSYPDFGGDYLVEPVKDEDIIEVAKLVNEDSEVGYYELQDLANQFIERRNNGMGRNYVIREDKKIIGHMATYAELDKIAVIGGLVVDEKSRGKLLGAVIEGYLVRELLHEGFTVYCVVTARKSRILERMGNPAVSEYVKMTKKERGKDS